MDVTNSKSASQHNRFNQSNPLVETPGLPLKKDTIPANFMGDFQSLGKMAKTLPESGILARFV